MTGARRRRQGGLSASEWNAIRSDEFDRIHSTKCGGGRLIFMSRSMIEGNHG
jgi:hypothetical protein